MRHPTITILLTLAVLLGGAGEGFALPPYSGTYNETTWTNCVGILTDADRGKYVGEWKDGEFNGQGTYIFADGRVDEGIWENDEFKYAQKP